MNQIIEHIDFDRANGNSANNAHFSISKNISPNFITFYNLTRFSKFSPAKKEIWTTLRNENYLKKSVALVWRQIQLEVWNFQVDSNESKEYSKAIETYGSDKKALSFPLCQRKVSTKWHYTNDQLSINSIHQSSGV